MNANTQSGGLSLGCSTGRIAAPVPIVFNGFVFPLEGMKNRVLQTAVPSLEGGAMCSVRLVGLQFRFQRGLSFPLAVPAGRQSGALYELLDAALQLRNYLDNEFSYFSTVEAREAWLIPQPYK